MVYGDEDALAYDERAAMAILEKEFDWYTHVREYMDTTFHWFELHEDDDDGVFLDAMYALAEPRSILVHLMKSIEIHHQDFSAHKSIINEHRANFYNSFFEISHKASGAALKAYLASFQPSANSLPFPHPDSKEEDKDGETSPQSENSNITSKNELWMITRKRKRSPGEEEEEEEEESGVIHPPLPQPEMITKNRKRSPDEAEEEESVASGYTYYPLPPPLVFDKGYFPRDYDMYHDHSKCDLNYSFDDENVDYYFDSD